MLSNAVDGAKLHVGQYYQWGKVVCWAMWLIGQNGKLGNVVDWGKWQVMQSG